MTIGSCFDEPLTIVLPTILSLPLLVPPFLPPISFLAGQSPFRSRTRIILGNENELKGELIESLAFARPTIEERIRHARRIRLKGFDFTRNRPTLELIPPLCAQLFCIPAVCIYKRIKVEKCRGEIHDFMWKIYIGKLRIVHPLLIERIIKRVLIIGSYSPETGMKRQARVKIRNYFPFFPANGFFYIFQTK